eukprot:12055792-Heterocapsa_arctica.AAC.1
MRTAGRARSPPGCSPPEHASERELPARCSLVPHRSPAGICRSAAPCWTAPRTGAPTCGLVPLPTRDWAAAAAAS